MLSPKSLFASILLMVAISLANGLLGYALADSRWRARHAELLREHAQQYQAVIQTQYDDLVDAVARADQASTELLAANRQVADLTEQLSHRVPHVSTVYVERPGAPSRLLPERPFTAGWVRDYNAALGLFLPAPADHSGRDARAPARASGAGLAGGEPGRSDAQPH